MPTPAILFSWDRVALCAVHFPTDAANVHAIAIRRRAFIQRVGVEITKALLP